MSGPALAAAEQVTAFTVGLILLIGGGTAWFRSRSGRRASATQQGGRPGMRALLRGTARTFMLLWVLLWLLLSVFGIMGTAGATGYTADAWRRVGVAWYAVIVTQVAILVLAGLFSGTHRPNRVRVVALLAATICPPAAFLLFVEFADAQLGGL